MAGLFLEPGDGIPHEIQNAVGKLLALGSGEILAQEVQAGFVHADQADGIEMVEPIAARALFDIFQIVGGIGIHAPGRLFLNGFALDLQALFGRLHQIGQPQAEFLFGFGEISSPKPKRNTACGWPI